MSIGIGLGAFVDGVEKGMEVRESGDKAKRVRDHQKALNDINKDAKQAFNEGVNAGQFNPEQYDEFWKKYAMPKIKMQMIEAGDYGGAQKFEEWGLSNAALEGGRLSAQALLQAQMGDGDGAIATGIKASQVGGYMSHGMQLVSQAPVMDKDDNTKRVGTNFVLKTPDGKEIEQYIASGDEAKVIGTITNPVNAWATRVAAEKEAKEKQEKQNEASQKRVNDLQDYADKKKVDLVLGGGKDPDFEGKYAATHKALSENDFEFSKLSQPEQDAKVREQLNAGQEYSNDRKGDRLSGLGLGGGTQGGTAAKTGRLPPKRVIVDTSTGKIVDPSVNDVRPPVSGSTANTLDPNKKPFGLGL